MSSFALAFCSLGVVAVSGLPVKIFRALTTTSAVAKIPALMIIFRAFFLPLCFVQDPFAIAFRTDSRSEVNPRSECTRR